MTNLDKIKTYAMEVAAGAMIPAAITGVIMTVAAYRGAIVPVKWKPLWSKWFWNKNH